VSASAGLLPGSNDASPEWEVARDLARRGLIAAPVLVGLAGLAFGVDGAISAAFSLALVLANFLVAAGGMAAGARISVGALMGAVVGGYVLRLALIGLAVWGASTQPWFEPVPLSAVLIIAHLGLLAWETRYVAATLAHPGLAPGRDPSTRSGKEMSAK
jgi:hypothetical protein